MWPILGMFFHPVYTVVNAAVVGHMGTEDETTKLLASLGLGSLTTGILLISIVSCFSMVANSFIAPAFGDKRYDLAKRYTYRQYILNTIVYLVCWSPA